MSALTHWVPGEACVNQRWEDAYRRFETVEQEKAKFQARFEELGVREWEKTSRVVELFCGSGAGLQVLEKLGFTNLAGVDLSPHLLAQYTGPAELFVGDCRELNFADDSVAAFTVQGGVHHLPDVEADLPRVLTEIHRCLEPGGRVLFVEPWLTPFLRLAHGLCGLGPLRAIWPKLDALAIMIEEERTTYEAWLARPDFIRRAFRAQFSLEREAIGGGKWKVVGRKA